MVRIGKKIAALLNWFPCPACRSGDGGGENDFCAACMAGFEPLRPRRPCPGCGAELDGVMRMCNACMNDAPRRWQDAAAIFRYNASTREMVRRFKFGREGYLAAPLAKIGSELVRQRGFDVDCAVPIPIPWRRRWQRGYNQAALFGKGVASGLGIDFVEPLCRRWDARRQSELEREERLKHLRDTVFLKPSAVRLISGRKVLLVDDVLTTGSTLSVASELLLKAGAKKIYVLVIARAINRSN